ncbi:MAG: hypothetical protein M3619_00575 [Myxococcota bacterium]|nr:hypothetical protein [Myxococcota bacterium]
MKSADLNDIQDQIVILAGGASVPNIVCTTVTASGNVQAAEFKHTDALKLIIPVASTIDPNATHTRQASGSRWTLGASVNRIVYPITLPIGSRITAWELYLNKISAAAQVISGRLYRMHEDGTEQARLVGATNNQNAPGPTFLSEIGNEDLVLQYQYYLVLNPAAGGAGDNAAHALIFYTRP